MFRYRIYWNLHKKVWSLQDCKTGRVFSHAEAFTLYDAKFVVRKAGQAKVRREGKKNVHAFVRGEISYFPDFDPDHHPDYLDYTLVSYNPYKFDTFVDVYDTTPVRTAKRAMLELQPSMVVGDHRNRPYLYAKGAKP